MDIKRKQTIHFRLVLVLTLITLFEYVVVGANVW